MFFACQSSVFESPWSTELESTAPPPVCLNPFWLLLMGGFEGGEPVFVFFYSVVDTGGCGYLWDPFRAGAVTQEPRGEL